VAIHYELGDDHVALITIDRPEAKNALDLYHFRDLAAAWRRLRDDEGAWVAMIKGVGRNFMAGADLKTYIPQVTALQRRMTEGEALEIDGCRLQDGMDAVLRSLSVYKPIIAAINGPCVAGGMEMLGGIDIRIATSNARFGVMEPKRGLFAGGGTTARLPRQLAFPEAMEFLLTAEALPAQRALDVGLLNELVAEEDLLDRARWWAGRITSNRPVGGARDQGERAAGLGRRPRRGVQDRERARGTGLPQRGRQGGPPGLRRETPGGLFAAIALMWAREFEPDPAKYNPWGGAIAIGHPLGATGVRMTATLLNYLETTGGRFGFQTMCEGGGQGNCTVTERLG